MSEPQHIAVILEKIYDEIVKHNNDTQFRNRDHLTFDEATKYLGLPKATLYSFTSAKLIRYYKLRGRRLYFKKEDLDDFIINSDNLVKTKSEIQSSALLRVHNDK